MLESRSPGKLVLVWIWIAAFAIALALDGVVARALEPYRSLVRQSEVAEEVREGGQFVLVMVIALLLVVLHDDRWKAAAILLLSSAAAGILRAPLAVAVGRTRPSVHVAPFEFHPFNFSSSLFHAHYLSFPSGHTTLAFATAATLAHLAPRGRWLFYFGAALVGIERIAELAHYPSDVVGGALLGILAFRLSLRFHRYVCNKWEQRARRVPSQG